VNIRPDSCGKIVVVDCECRWYAVMKKYPSSERLSTRVYYNSCCFPIVVTQRWSVVFQGIVAIVSTCYCQYTPRSVTRQNGSQGGL
jgi:hypothetical protein